MLFHNKYTISIGKLGVLLDSQNINLVKRINIPMPKFLLSRAYSNLIVQVNETLNRTALNKEIETGILRTKLYNKAFNLYPALVDLCSITWDDKHLKKIEEITGLVLKKIEDRKFLIDETVRLQDKYRELLVEEKKEGISFIQVIINVEIILDFKLDRNLKLYEFEYYMKMASDKIREIETANEKRNGRIR